MWPTAITCSSRLGAHNCLSVAALVDASCTVLTHSSCLERCTGCRHGPTPAALKEYEAVRLPRAQEVQEGSTSLAKQVQRYKHC
jgi:2-polyprenyl-6-methoxyphenol hydroxylase-like FAD-dependent oxidoreductase